MILWLGEVSGLAMADLLSRPAKTGEAQVRGPLVIARESSAGRPLSALRPGEKLHVVAPGDGTRVAGMDPAGLVQHLAELGFEKNLQLKQIHLIAEDSGRGGPASFASRFLEALTSAGFQETEIKAPLGKVRCDSKGKIWIHLPEQDGWVPSERCLNLYCAPGAKHQAP
jgi:hypothetical protein